MSRSDRFRRIPWLLVAPLALAAGCNRESGRAVREEPRSRALIMDQLHNGGTEGFLFLPPMVPRPPSLGDIVPDLPVTVRVDEIRGDGSTIRSLATFTHDSGPRGERIGQHVENGPPGEDGDADPTGYYVARWKTADEDLSLVALYRVRVLVPAKGRGKTRELGFADVDVVRNQKAGWAATATRRPAASRPSTRTRRTAAAAAWPARRGSRAWPARAPSPPAGRASATATASPATAAR